MLYCRVYMRMCMAKNIWPENGARRARAYGVVKRLVGAWRVNWRRHFILAKIGKRHVVIEGKPSWRSTRAYQLSIGRHLKGRFNNSIYKRLWAKGGGRHIRALKAARCRQRHRASVAEKCAMAALAASK